MVCPAPCPCPPTETVLPERSAKNGLRVYLSCYPLTFSLVFFLRGGCAGPGVREKFGHGLFFLGLPSFCGFPVVPLSVYLLLSPPGGVCVPPYSLRVRSFGYLLLGSLSCRLLLLILSSLSLLFSCVFEGLLSRCVSRCLCVSFLVLCLGCAESSHLPLFPPCFLSYHFLSLFWAPSPPLAACWFNSFPLFLVLPFPSFVLDVPLFRPLLPPLRLLRFPLPSCLCRVFVSFFARLPLVTLLFSLSILSLLSPYLVLSCCGPVSIFFLDFFDLFLVGSWCAYRSGGVVSFLLPGPS